MEILNNIKHPISESLINTHNKEDLKKVSLIDMSDENDKWSFVVSSKIVQILKDNGWYIRQSSIKINKKLFEKYKSKAKIGKIINKVFPNQYKASEIEEFINLIKQSLEVEFDLIDIVDGEKLKHFYLIENYEDKNDNNDSILFRSCMSAKCKNNYIDFYVANKDKVSMVVLYSDDTKEKIDARGLLWDINYVNGKKVNNIKFMDRVYYNKQSHLNKLLKYAKNNGWFYKYNQDSIPSPNNIMDSSDNTNNKLLIENIKIASNKQFPYLDTLCYFDPYNMTLSNYKDDGKKYGVLNSQWGDVEELIWYDKEQRYYHNSDLVKAKNEDGLYYHPIDECIYLPLEVYYYTKEYLDKIGTIEVNSIYNSDSKKYIIPKNKAVYSKYYKKYYHEEQADWSELMKDYIPRDISVYAVDIESFIPKNKANKVVVDIIGGDYQYYYKDNPNKPYFKYINNGITEYYLNKILDTDPQYFDKNKIEYND